MRESADVCVARLVAVIRPFRWGCAAVALPLLAACATIHRPPATIATLLTDRDSVGLAERATTDSVVERLVRRVQRRGDRTLDILLLSGGGQHGAYGAGFLRGWKTRTDAPMPAFDLVSGISTGGLQAPFALLGTSDALDTLSTLYREATERSKPSLDLLYWLRKSGGLLKVGKLERTIATVFDERMAESLRREFAADRQLVIGTTDTDLGVGRTWDLARVLEDSAGLAEARRLLRATSAIPGIFPPVIIGGRVHADGGVMSNVMPVLELDDYRTLALRLRAAGVSEPVTVRLWVIMNLFVDPPLAVMNPASRGGMSSRATALLFFGQQSPLVTRFKTLAAAVSADVKGLRLELRSTALDPALAQEPGADALFHREWMIRIEGLGFERGRSAVPWDVDESRARP